MLLPCPAILRVTFGLKLQDRLLSEQERLQSRLQQALGLRIHPTTSVDTATIADKIINMFDAMLEASQDDFRDVLWCIWATCCSLLKFLSSTNGLGSFEPRQHANHTCAYRASLLKCQKSWT